MARKFAAAAFWVGCLHTGSVMALGLGELSLDSFLNEPLKAKVDLLDTAGLQAEQIRVRLATKEDFDRLGVERAYFLTGITFQVIIDGTDRGQIVLTSEDPVLEPYLDFIIEARWPSGRLLREYTVLVDPPVFRENTTVVSASELVGGAEGEKKVPSEPAGGTRVNLDTSAPATGAGSRQYGADTDAAPMAGGRYLIQRDDTLWEIASQARPAGTSVHQTMLDIQRLNPDAFIDGNINRIKAGYIIYLPASGDISSEDVDLALAEVRQQNDDWREGRASEPVAGPSLTISAGPAEQAASGAAGAAAGTSSAGTPEGADIAMQEMLAQVEREREAVESRLAAMEEQLRTLQQIVTLKDEQIAALQGALEEDEAEATEATDPAEAVAETPAVAVAEPEPEPAEPASVEPAASVPSTPSRPEPEAGGLPGGWMAWAAGAVVLLGGGLLWWRRRQEEEEEPDTDDLFADIELQQEQLEIEESEEPPVPAPVVAPEPEPAPEPEAEPEPEPEAIAAAEPDQGGSRGYGERKHDEYASDVDTGDVLAEADIYIAYGRQQQALELLNNAVSSEPGNPRLRLKLLSLYAEAGNSEAANEQYAQLQAIGDQPSLVEADHIMKGGPAGVADTDLPMDLDLELGDFDATDEESLDADFVGLEIEDDSPGFSDELDLSGDFEVADKEAAPASGEDMVFATEGNEMSTKLDLARAYIDMGDEEGARQILEEVASEGTDEQQQEARGLIERLG